MVLERLNFRFNNNDNKQVTTTQLQQADNEIDIFGGSGNSAVADGGIFSQNKSQTENIEGFTRTTDEAPQTQQEEHSAFSDVQLNKPVKKSKIISNLPKALKSSDGSEKSKKEIISYIKSISSDNVASVLRDSETILGVNPLVKEIFKTNGLNGTEKKDALKHIYEQAKAYAEEKGIHTEDFLENLKKNIDNYDPKAENHLKIEGMIVADFRKLSDRSKPKDKPVATNGELDRSTQQGKAGDCWLLATVNGYLNTEDGKKYINDCVSKDEKTGNIMVKLPGAKKEYTVTQEEINNSTNYSSGDGDVRAVEIAVQKFYEERESSKSDIYGQQSNMGLHLFGNSNDIYFIYNPQDREATRKEMSAALDEMAKDKKFNTVAVTAILSSSKVDGPKGTIPGGTITLGSGHAYTLVGVSRDEVTLIDPNNSGERITVKKDDYLSHFNNISYMKVKNPPAQKTDETQTTQAQSDTENKDNKKEKVK